MSDTIKIDGDKFVEMQSEITRLRSLIQRMSAVGDEMADKSHVYSYTCNYVYCPICDEYLRFGDERKTTAGHAPDCPVTRWKELKKEMEG